MSLKSVQSIQGAPLFHKTGALPCGFTRLKKSLQQLQPESGGGCLSFLQWPVWGMSGDPWKSVSQGLQLETKTHW